MTDQAKPEENRGVTMPPDIEADPVQSEIWAWVAPPVNNYTEQDMPNLRLLVYWHAVASQAQQALHSEDGTLRIFDKIGVKPFKTKDGREIPLVRKSPALQVMRDASIEIRALTELLGLTPGAARERQPAAPKGGGVLKMVLDDRGRRAAGAR